MRFACYEYCASVPDTDLVGMHLISTCSSYIHTHTDTDADTNEHVRGAFRGERSNGARALSWVVSAIHINMCERERAQNRKAATMRPAGGGNTLLHNIFGTRFTWRPVARFEHACALRRTGRCRCATDCAALRCLVNIFK